MPHKIIIVLILGAAISLVSPDVHAQADDPAKEPVELKLLFNPDEGSGELRAIKERIQSLLRQNEELAPRAESLKQEFWDLQKKVRRSRAEAAALEQKHAENQKKMEQQAQKKLEQKAENTRESGRPQSLQQLRLYDLQYQKKELELELKLKELALKEKQQAYDRQMAEWHQELEQNAAEEKRLADETWASRDNAAPVYELESLKQENMLLESQLKLPVPPQSSAGTKEDLSGRAGPVWEAVRRKEEQKERLERGIERLRLEKDQERSSSDVNSSSFEKEFRGSVERLEQENKELKDRIFSLREKNQKRSY